MEFDHIGVPAPARRGGTRVLEAFDEVRVGFIEVDGAPVELVQPY